MHQNLFFTLCCILAPAPSCTRAEYLFACVCVYRIPDSLIVSKRKENDARKAKLNQRECMYGFVWPLPVLLLLLLSSTIQCNSMLHSKSVAEEINWIGSTKISYIRLHSNWYYTCTIWNFKIYCNVKMISNAMQCALYSIRCHVLIFQ